MLEQAPVAALRVAVALGLEVDVARPGPGALGQRRVGAVPHQRLPAIHRVAGAVEPEVAQAGLVERDLPARVRGPAAQEVLVGARRVAIALLVEARVGDVEHRGAHDVLAAGGAVEGEQTLLGRDREAVASLLGAGPGQELLRRGTHRMIGKLASQALERRLGLGVAAERRLGVGVDQERVGPPGRAAGGHLLEQEVRRPGELTRVPGEMIGVLEHAQGRFHELPMLG